MGVDVLDLPPPPESSPTVGGGTIFWPIGVVDSVHFKLNLNFLSTRSFDEIGGARTEDTQGATANLYVGQDKCVISSSPLSRR